jgi:hypothetical protein
MVFMYLFIYFILVRNLSFSRLYKTSVNVNQATRQNSEISAKKNLGLYCTGCHTCRC